MESFLTSLISVFGIGIDIWAHKKNRSIPIKMPVLISIPIPMSIPTLI